jgi:hypothetical protein
MRYEPARGARPRDPDLEDRDRVDVLLDIDRDYTTYFRLTVDHRGWARDMCAGDVSWNPNWFIAAEETAEAWTVEAAVPLDQLGRRPPGSGEAWCVNVQRTAPGVGFQAWSHPAAVLPRADGFGLLIFQ